MTYAEIKNKFTSIESINTRLEEINKEYDNQDVVANKLMFNYREEVNNFLSYFGVNDGDIQWNCKRATTESLGIEMTNDHFYDLTIYAQYEDVYNKDYTDSTREWKFQMNVGSCGSFDIHNPSERSKKSTAYYKLVATIMDETVASDLEEVCKRNVDKLNELRQNCRNLRSEEKQLELLKKNIEKEAQSTEYLETAKNTEDKTMVVIINKNADPSECVAIHRGTPCSICSLPVELEKWPEEDKKCKTMNKNDKNAKYISTRIQFLKFTK